MKRAWAYMVAVATMITAVIFFWLEGRSSHKKKVVIDALNKESASKTVHIEQARETQKTINYHRLRADAAKLKGEEKLDELRKNNSNLADRVDSYRKRNGLRRS